MIIIIGLIILVAALIIGVAGVLSNGGTGHALAHFSVLGYHVTGSAGTLFLYGIVVGAAGLLGLSFLLAGARRTSRRGSAARRGLRQSRRETAAASRDRDDLIGQLDAARATTADTTGNGTAPPEIRSAARVATAGANSWLSGTGTLLARPESRTQIPRPPWPPLLPPNTRQPLRRPRAPTRRQNDPPVAKPAVDNRQDHCAQDHELGALLLDRKAAAAAGSAQARHSQLLLGDDLVWPERAQQQQRVRRSPACAPAFRYISLRYINSIHRARDTLSMRDLSEYGDAAVTAREAV